jgi:hypothetical protein
MSVCLSMCPYLYVHVEIIGGMYICLFCKFDLTVYLSVNLSIYPSVYLSAYLSVCLPCLPIYLSACPVCLPSFMYFCLTLCLSVCLSVCLAVCLSDCSSVCLNFCLTDCLSICRPVKQCVYLSICTSSRLCIHPSVCPTISWPFVRLSVCPSVRLSVCLSVYLPIHLSVYLSVCPSVSWICTTTLLQKLTSIFSLITLMLTEPRLTNDVKKLAPFKYWTFLNNCLDPRADAPTLNTTAIGITTFGKTLKNAIISRATLRMCTEWTKPLKSSHEISQRFKKIFYKWKRLIEIII